MSEWAFAGELDVGRLVDELEKRGATVAAVEADVDEAGQPGRLLVSFGVDDPTELGAGGTGHRILRDSLRVTFKHGAVPAQALARRRR